MKYQPRDYQKRMTDFIIEHERCGLFAEMGLGKTVTTLTAIHELMYLRFDTLRALIVAPLRVALITWPEEIQKWDHTRQLSYSVIYGNGSRSEALNANTDIHIMSYSTLPWLVEYLKKHKVFPFTYDLVVFDESTYIKTKTSQRWTICNALFYDVPRKIILTGTPSPNGLHDLWGQIFHLDHGRALGASLTEFRNRYFLRDGQRYLPLRNARTSISQQLAHLVMPMKSKDYLSLPKFSQNTVKCHLPKKLRSKYEELEKDFFIEVSGMDVTAFDAASVSMKLRQFCQGFLINDEEGISSLHRLKIDALRDIVDNTEDRILVAVQFHQDIEMIRQEFGNVPCIYGKTTVQQDIKTIADWNQKRIPLLVAHPGSLAHGVNLQHGGHTIVWFGMTWSLEHHDQFNARIYRQGQTHPVMAHYILMDDTIDLAVMQAIKRKTNTQYQLMREIQEYRKQKQKII